MMWVLRAGKNGIYTKDFIDNKRAYICWNGYDDNLANYSNAEEFKNLAKKEKANTTTTAIATRASQLRYFAKEICLDDLLLIPTAHSNNFVLARVVGDYEYKADDFIFPHSRKIAILHGGISSTIFPQNIRYSLGAFRNLFHAKSEQLIISMINENYDIDWRNR